MEACDANNQLLKRFEVVFRAEDRNKWFPKQIRIEQFQRGTDQRSRTPISKKK